eukprot:227169_1
MIQSKKKERQVLLEKKDEECVQARVELNMKKHELEHAQQQVNEYTTSLRNAQMKLSKVMRKCDYLMTLSKKQEQEIETLRKHSEYVQIMQVSFDEKQTEYAQMEQNMKLLQQETQ